MAVSPSFVVKGSSTSAALSAGRATIENEWIICYVTLAVIINLYMLQHNKVVVLTCPVVSCEIRLNVDFRQSCVDVQRPVNELGESGSDRQPWHKICCESLIASKEH